MKPTHRLKVLDKTTEGRGEVGAGWLNEDGSISIKLNPCVVLKQRPELVFTLFPIDNEYRESLPRSRRKARSSAASQGPATSQGPDPGPPF